MYSHNNCGVINNKKTWCPLQIITDSEKITHTKNKDEGYYTHTPQTHRHTDMHTAAVILYRDPVYGCLPATRSPLTQTPPSSSPLITPAMTAIVCLTILTTNNYEKKKLG